MFYPLRDTIGMENTYQTFEDLLIWQEGMEICYQVYEKLNTCRDYGLNGQMERSAISVPSNIAEGYELSTDRGFLRHLYIAKGSNAELRTQLYIAIRRRYMSSHEGNELLVRSKNLSKMIQKFIAARKKRMIGKFIKSILFFFALK